VSIEEISVHELHALGSDATIVDVRETHEWEQAHVSHARHVALGTVPDRLDDFDGAPTYVMCQVGGRSMRACEFAAASGHSVVNVAGGMIAWLEAGFEIESGSDV
jgi:rhodanese-related sulfurtransferase